MPFITTTDAADDDAIPRKSQVEELIAVASGAAEDAQEAADAAQAAADAAQATADAALPASARAADVNPAGTDIAAALGGKLPLSGGTMDENAVVNLFNGSRWQQSTPDKGIAGTAGFSVICSAGYEYKFANGYLFILSDGSSTVRKVLYAPAAPTAAADTTLGFTTDTTWEMADGTLYECTDATATAAVWVVVPAADATKLPLAGGTMDENAVVNLFNGSRWQQSTPDKGIAGAAGFSIICSVGYEYKFALGFLFILSDNSTTVRKVLYAPATPTATDDTTLGFTTETTWEMADGTQYHCTDVTEGAAVWEVVPAFDPAAPGPLGDTTPDVVNTTELNVKDSGGTTTASIDGADGFASFANGFCTINLSGGISVGKAGYAGTQNFIGNDGTTTASINGSDGSASFGYNSGLVGLYIDQFGNLTTNNSAEASLYNFNAANIVSAASGAITLGTNTGTAAWINSDGSAQLANGALTIGSDGYTISSSAIKAANGLVSIGSMDGTVAWINSDGTASFASGQVTIDQWGDVQTGAQLTIGGANGFAGFLNVKNDGGTVIASISGNDGSGEFASQAITLGKSTGTAAWIEYDGSASFASVTTPSLNVQGVTGGTTQVDSTGTLTMWSNNGSGQKWLKLDSNEDSVKLYNSAGGYSDPPTITFTSSDGSASLTSASFLGEINVVNYGTTIGNDIKLGGGSFKTGSWPNYDAASINNDGSARFANGALTIGTDGSIIYGAGSAGYLNSDGSAGFAFGALTIGTDGNLTFAGALIGGTQSLTTSGGAGAVNLTTLTTEVETTGTLDALTLANGTVGQIKVITHTAGAFTSVLTPTTALGFTTITFLASLGQTCTLEYTNAGWAILAVGGLTLPVVA